MEKIIFEVEGVDLLKEDNDSQFSTAKILAFSSGENRNNYTCSEEVLRETAFTIYNKPVLYSVSEILDDFASHNEPGQSLIAGFVVPDSVEFISLDNGRIGLSVIAKVWNRYAPKVIEFFKRDGDKKKKVSVEMELYEKEQRVDGLTEMLGFVYSGICLLGDYITEGSPGASAQMVSFEKEQEEYNEAYTKEFGDQDNTDDEIIEKDTTILLDSEEEATSSFELPKDDIPEDDDKEDCDPIEEMGCGKEKQMEFNFEKILALFDIESDSYKTLFAESQKEKEEIDSQLVLDILFGKIDSMQELLVDKDGTIETLEQEKVAFSEEIASLKEYKDGIEKERFEFEIATTLKDVEDFVPKDELDALKEESANFSLETIDGWRNAVKAKAFVYTKDFRKDENTPDVKKVGMPFRNTSKESKKSLWD